MDLPGAVVLGMHRSGTSLTTRVLALLGLALCRDDDLMAAGDANPDGHWESLSLTASNDVLLAEIGCAWWSPPAAPITLTRHRALRQHLGQLRTLFSEAYPRSHPWVWKDPRGCLTLPVWRDALTVPPVAVVVLRDPVEIAASLHRRDGMPVRAGLALWERYVHHLLRAIAGLPTLITQYDDLLDNPAGWCATAAPVLTHLAVVNPTDLRPAAGAVRPSYRHHRIGPEPMGQNPLTPEQTRLATTVTELAGWYPTFPVVRLPEESPGTPHVLAAMKPPATAAAPLAGTAYGNGR